MKFIKVPSPEVAADVLLERLKLELEGGKKVLWFVSGGSAVSSEAIILQSLQQTSDLSNLTIMLMDERYGATGHTDSNWQQLIQAGCNFENVQTIPVLSEPQKPLEATAAAYAQKLTVALANADEVIGLFGLGEDAHTAGILPGSPATTDTTQLVVSYETPQFIRITLSRYALTQITSAYVFAFGANKLTALQRLENKSESFVQLPAMLLYDIAECSVYNDQLEGSEA